MFYVFISDPSEPPPSYEEAQGMTTGPGQYPQQYPQPDAYQAGKPFEVMSVSYYKDNYKMWKNWHKWKQLILPMP